MSSSEQAGSTGSQSQTQLRLLTEFRKFDRTGSGRMDLMEMLQILGKIGLGNADANRLVEGSGALVPVHNSIGINAKAEVDYASFIGWLLGAGNADIMDAGYGPNLQVALPGGAPPTANVGGWVDRCARVLETRSEIDFVQKKMISTQVRAHLRAMEEKESADAPIPCISDILLEEILLPSSPQPASHALEAQPRKRELRWDGPALLERLLQDGPADIPGDYVDQVLDAVIEELPRYFPRPLARLRVPDPGRLVVVGDTHGQLQDVLLIFLLHGLPSATNSYLFNGDVADRGPHACAIFLLVFAFFLQNPSTVLLIRGNHEDEQMNYMSADEGGGFYDECMQKYGEATYLKFVQVFKLLPLAATINDEVFVVHGGISGGPPPSLSDIDAISHTAVCCPALDAETDAECLFVDLLWSDPWESPGHEPNPRGCGSLWGPDITKNFLQKNGLRWIIRSHELPHDGERGWMEHHLGLVFTLFSASNYWGYEVNWGAVAILTVGSDGRVEQALREHNIPSLEILAQVLEAPEGLEREERCQEIGLSWVDSDRVAVGERRVQLALRRLAGIVLEFKPELWQQFLASDPENTGTVSRPIWIQSLVAACGDNLPWEEASKFWIADGEGIVDYREFLHRFKVVLAQEKWCGWKSLLIADVYEELLMRNVAAQDMLRSFDPSGDGIVSVEDFRQFMQEWSGGSLSEPQVAALSRTVFANSLGRGLRMSAFLSRFTLAFVQSKGMSPAHTHGPLADIGPTVEQIGRLIVRAQPNGLCPLPPQLERCISLSPPGPPPPPPIDFERANTALPPAPLPLLRDQSTALVRTFEKFDDTGDGFVKVEEFVRHVMALPGFEGIRHSGKALDEATLRSIAQAIASESSTTGTINLLQFARAFAVVDASGCTDLADDLHEHILTFLYRHQHAMRSSCLEHDLDASGKVSKRQFAQVLEAVNFCTARPKRHLTRMQMSVLAESVAEDNGVVEYEAFLSSFEVHTGS